MKGILNEILCAICSHIHPLVFSAGKHSKFNASKLSKFWIIKNAIVVALFVWARNKRLSTKEKSRNHLNSNFVTFTKRTTFK